jgi:hypothetical protein
MGYSYKIMGFHRVYLLPIFIPKNSLESKQATVQGFDLFDPLVQAKVRERFGESIPKNETVISTPQSSPQSYWRQYSNAEAG